MLCGVMKGHHRGAPASFLPKAPVYFDRPQGHALTPSVCQQVAEPGEKARNIGGLGRP